MYVAVKNADYKYKDKLMQTVLASVLLQVSITVVELFVLIFFGPQILLLSLGPLSLCLERLSLVWNASVHVTGAGESGKSTIVKQMK